MLVSAVAAYVARDRADASCNGSGSSSGSGTGTGTGSGTGAVFTDFAGCTTPLGTCSATVTSCCVKDMTTGAYSTYTDGAIVIPLDRCHQTSGTGSLGAPGLTYPDNSGNGWCGDKVGSTNAGGSTADNGMFEAYGMVYRLMQQGINVHWVINPYKTPPKLTAAQNASTQQYITTDVDFWILDAATAAPPGPTTNLTACVSPACTGPVKRLSVSAGWAPKTGSYQFHQFPVRGSAFIIAPEDSAKVLQFIKRTGTYSGLASDSNYDWTEVDMYEVQSGAKFVFQNFTTASPYTNIAGAPVSQRLDFKPPRLARQSPSSVSTSWLGTAKLAEASASTCASGSAFSPTDAVYCDMDISQMTSGSLVSGNFQWAWIDNWSDNTPCANAAEQAQVDQMRTFMTAVPGVRSGGSVMFMQAAIQLLEGCSNKQVMGKVGTATGLVGNNQAPSEPMILRNPGSLFMQWGDVPTAFASGSPGSWFYTTAQGSAGYDSTHTNSTSGTLIRLVTQDGGTGSALCTAHTSTATCDVFSASSPDNLDAYAYLRYQDDANNGLAVYMGGNQISNNGNQAHLRAVLDAFLAVQVSIAKQVTTILREESRSAPVVATVGGTTAQYQGSFEVTSATTSSYTGSADNTTFEFPFYKGHIRAFNTSSVTSTATSFSSLTSLFDAGADTMIPTVNTAGCGSNFTSSCRTVFTTTQNPDATGLSLAPTKVYFGTNNHNALKPLLSSTLNDTDTDTLISRVLKGSQQCDGTFKSQLGGIDRSTMSVIEASPNIANNRPTMIYVGALDGGLHAICAEAKGACDKVGRELWWYIPKTQLGNLRLNTQRIDGSPKVADMFGVWSGSTATWKTVLTFQTGSGSELSQTTSPAVVAMDVTDPANPSIMWVRVVPATRTSVNLGTGLGLAMGPVRVAGQTRNVVFAETDNGGTGGAGVYVAAYDVKDGSLIWHYDELYPNPPRAIATDAVVPTTGLPGGVAAFDQVGSGYLTQVAVPTLYGELWELNTNDGSNAFGTVPLFKFSTNYHPIGAAPSLFRDSATSRIGIVIADGGYVDPTSASWAQTTTHHYVIGFLADASVANAPMNELSSTYGGERKFEFDLGANERVWASPVVAGDEVLAVSDQTDPNTSTYASTSSSTGKLWRFKLDTGSQLGSAVTIIGGGSGFDVTPSTGIVYIGSATSAQKIDVNTTGGGGTFNSAGTAIELQNQSGSTKQMLWLSK